MRLQMFDDIRVIRDQRAVEPGPPKQQLLLAVLSCRLNRMTSTPNLVHALWPAGPPASASANLRSYVHGLRKVLSSGCLTGNGQPGYLLAVDPDAVDVLRFGVLADRGAAALAAGDVAGARRDLRAAHELWRGRPFGTAADAPALAADGARLRERRLLVIESLVDADLRAGLSGELVPRLVELVGRHPYRERFSLQLMRALERSGRRAEALDVYRRTYRTLVDDLGIEPGRELREIQHEILAGSRGTPRR